MRILGIDPGIAIVGFGLIESDRGAMRMLQYGAVTTEAGLPLATRNRPLPSPDDFYHLLPCEVTEESQLHSLFEVAWAIWLQQGDRFERLNGIPTEHRLTPLQRFNILNNLIEKSINNYIVTEDWRKHHE